MFIARLTESHPYFSPFLFFPFLANGYLAPFNSFPNEKISPRSRTLEFCALIRDIGVLCFHSFYHCMSFRFFSPMAPSPLRSYDEFFLQQKRPSCSLEVVVDAVVDVS